MILIDIRLPDINVLTLTKMLKKANPKLIVKAQTAYVSSKDIQDATTIL
jgi:CheY-like chemotaxis protein